MSKKITIDNTDKYYGNFQAIRGVSLEMKQGEFFTLLGPSGCGKTTLLRMIAGFITIEKGEIRFDDAVINHVPTYRRNIGMVFQSYAIFPHLSVEQNVAYGLKPRKISREETKRRTEWAMDLTQITEYRERPPQKLSGGQQQRVALARAIVIEPDVLLMDEPLSNLDAKLRVAMRTSIRELQQKLGITTVYVTHDQEEALAVSDRIAVMNGGAIEQVGQPIEIYDHPVNEFVASFIGVSNTLPGVSDGQGVWVTGATPIPLALREAYRGDVVVSARPQDIRLTPPAEGGLHGAVKSATFLGDFIHYIIELDGGMTVQANQYIHEDRNIRTSGERVGLRIARMNVFTADGKKALL